MKFVCSSFCTCCIALLTTTVFAHSGGTNSSGCHGGSVPYHCHGGGGTSFDEYIPDAFVTIMDLTFGYSFKITSKLNTYVGLSMATDNSTRTTPGIGGELGIFYDKWYLGYVSASNSYQMGYQFFHFSVYSNYADTGKDAIGFGVRGDLGKMMKSSGFYSSVSSSLFDK